MNDTRARRIVRPYLTLDREPRADAYGNARRLGGLEVARYTTVGGKRYMVTNDGDAIPMRLLFVSVAP